MEQKLPPSSKRESSTYADEGTALHECMQHILMNNIVDLEEIRGMTFGVSETSPAGYVMTDDLIHNAIVPCVEFFDGLDEKFQDEGGLTFFVEQRVRFPGIPGAFGTCDLVARTTKRTIIVDWKFGAGVLVKASYLDDKGNTKPNAQLMFYARAAQHSLPTFFEDGPDWLVQMYIVQPRARNADADEISSKVVVNLRELEQFRMELIRAVAEAKGGSARVERGDHCRFAKCKAICPHFTQPGFALTQLHEKLTSDKTVTGAIATDWPTLYSELLDYCTIAELGIAEIRAGAHALMETGEKVPGWKLVDKRGIERYADEQGAVRHVIGMGVPSEETFETIVKSPAQLRTALEPHMDGKTKKARTEAAKAEIAKFTTTKSSGTTLAKADDRREDAIIASDLISSLTNKLAALTGQ